MAREFTVKIINARKVSFAPMACDVAIGYTNNDNQFVGLITIPDFILKKSATKGYFYSGPSKPRLKNGEPVVENGYPVYNEFFKLFMEKGANAEDPSKTSPTKAAFEFRKYLIGLMVDAMKQIGGDDSPAPAPRPARTMAKPARAIAKPAAAVAEVDEEEVDVPFDEDDELPF